jgi:transposase
MPKAQPALPPIPDAAWLSAKQVAAEFGVNEDTVLRWWHQGLPTGRDRPLRKAAWF